MIVGEIAKGPIGKSFRLFHPALLPCLAACEGMAGMGSGPQQIMDN